MKAPNSSVTTPRTLTLGWRRSSSGLSRRICSMLVSSGAASPEPTTADRGFTGVFVQAPAGVTGRIASTVGTHSTAATLSPSSLSSAPQMPWTMTCAPASGGRTAAIRTAAHGPKGCARCPPGRTPSDSPSTSRIGSCPLLRPIAGRLAEPVAVRARCVSALAWLSHRAAAGGALLFPPLRLSTESGLLPGCAARRTRALRLAGPLLPQPRCASNRHHSFVPGSRPAITPSIRTG